MKTAAIVVLYNPTEEVQHNIITYENFVDKVILVDNSDKKISSELETVFYNAKKYVYISLKGNLGLAKALNIGIEKAFDLGMTHVLTMDQDSKFKNNIIKIYEEYYNNPIFGKEVILCPHYQFKRSNRAVKKEKFERKKYVMQSANHVSVDLYKKLGVYKEDFFIDVVDYEFCLRARSMRVSVVQCNEAVLEHEPGLSQQREIAGLRLEYGQSSPSRYYYQVRNLIWTFKKYKNISMLKWAVIKYLKIILLFDEKIAYLQFANKGLKDGLKNRLGKLE